MLIALLLLFGLGLASCQKNTYCQCYAYVDDEDVSLGDDAIDFSSLTETQIDSLKAKYKYNLYILDEGSCNDKAAEIQGWNRVACVQVNPKMDTSWLLKLFSKNKN